MKCVCLATEAEKDDDADPDPDYCPKLVDFDDREEFQHVNVSKKEVNDLFNELYNSLPEDLLNEITDAIAFDTNPPKQISVQSNNNLNDTLITPVKRIESTLSTPEPNKDESQIQNPVASPAPSNATIGYFDPNAISTPAKPNFNNNTISPATQQQHQQSFDSFNSTLLQINESSTQSYSFQYPTYSLSPLDGKSHSFVPVMQYTTNSNTAINAAATPYSSFLIKASCESITTTAMPSTVISSIQIDSGINQIAQLNRQIQGGPAPKKIGSRAKRSRFKNASYRELEHLDPNSIQPQVSKKDLKPFFF